MIEILDKLQGSIFTAFVDGLLDILNWMTQLVIGILTGINTLIGYASSNISNLVSVFNANSGVVTMVNTTWSAIPSSFRALAILMIVTSATIIMVRRL